MANQAKGNNKRNTKFNPIKIEKDGVTARRMIWSTEAFDLALKGLAEGKKLVANPFYDNNPKLIKSDLVFERTPYEVEEWKKCKKDILYFASKCKLMTPEGIKKVKMRNYQEKYLKHLQDNRLSIYLACRQCAKTTTSAIFLLWYALFNTDKNTLVVGNKRKTAVEILDKTKKIFLELPFYLKPGINKWNEGEIVLDNGCRIMAEATTINSGISFTFHCVLWDEAAHVAPNIIDKFYNNLFPTITAGKARFMITSTQNGYNLFYRLWTFAEQGLSEYAPFKTDWYEVPEWNPDKRCWEPRDEKWHQQQIANYGSEEAFNKQFGTNFDINANTLISAKVFQKLRPIALKFVIKDLPGVEYADRYYWKPDFDPVEDLRKSHIVITIDISEGLHQDFTTYCFNRLIDKDGTTDCIGIFHANELSIEQCTLSLQRIICLYMNMERTLVSFERNMFGDLFVKNIFDNIEKVDGIDTIFDQSILVKYYNKNNTSYELGIKVTSGNKTAGCLLFKMDIERSKIINQSTLFLCEAENFSDSKGNNTFAASFGHDDVVMAQMQMVFVKQTLQFINLLEDYSNGDSESSLNDTYNAFEQTEPDDPELGIFSKQGDTLYDFPQSNGGASSGTSLYDFPENNSDPQGYFSRLK